MAIVLRSGFWEIVFREGRAAVTSLRFDAQGCSRWCPNLLKTGAPRRSHLRLTAPTGAQTGYVDSSGTWHLSGEADSPTIRAVSMMECELDDVNYGSVTERWRFRLDGPKLEWTVSQTWREKTEIADALVPGLFFSGQTPWGEPTVFVLWDRGMAKDAFYGTGSILGPECQTKSTRQTRIIAGGWTIAKLLSHACPNGDLRVTASHHVKKGEIVNFCSVLGQAPWCDAEGPRTLPAGERIETSLTLQTDGGASGVGLDLAMEGPLSGEAAINRRFFDTYANCGVMADTHDWRLGNQPSGYVAILCRYFHAEMLKFGVVQGSLGPNTTNVHRVLIDEVTRMAEHLVNDGTAGPGYQSTTSLDIYPSYLLCMRDVLLLTGDRKLGELLWQGARQALSAVFGQIDEGEGMIRAVNAEGNDYWDWISRNGHIGYVNVVAWMSLRAASEVARWLGRASEIPAIDARAAQLRDNYERDFWNEERGYYADWIDADGVARFYLYAPPQLMAVAVGMVSPERARRVVDAVIARRRELGPAWEQCFSIQTNLYDAEEFSFMKRRFNADVTRFGQTMNGGCLASWNYFWIGALVHVGRVDEALRSWQRFLARFAQTSLVEGCNYWDYAGKPSRTVIPEMIPREFLSYDLISAEPFLADQGLVACVLPRWLLGIELTFDGVTTRSVLPDSAHPVTVSLLHLGQEMKLSIA